MIKVITTVMTDVPLIGTMCRTLQKISILSPQKGLEIPGW